MAPAVAVNAADEDPAATATDPGTVRALLLLDAKTVAPFAGAALESVTAQLVLPLADIVVLEHCSEETVAGAINDNVVVWEEPLSVAVMVAL